MSIKNVKLRFNLNKDSDRRAYDYLQNAEMSYSKAAIFAICRYLELSEIQKNEDAFLERIITTIREETAKSNPLSGLLQIVQPTVKTPSNQKDDLNKEETEEEMLDFLDNF